MRNSSNSHWQRSTIRQRTTPWIAGVGPSSIDAHERGAMLVLQERRLTRRLAINEATRAVRVEAQNPVANDLKRHAADLRRLAARRAVVDRRERQEPARLRPVLRALAQSPEAHPRQSLPAIQSQPPWRTPSSSPSRIRRKPIREDPMSLLQWGSVLRCVERCWPSTRQAKRSDTPNASLARSTQARRRAGLKSFPTQPPSGSASQASDQTPPCEAGRSPARDPSAA